MAEKQKFYEEINTAIRAVVTALIEKFPELDGAAVALTYSAELGDVPNCLVLGDLTDAPQLCRTGAQVARLQSMIAQGVASHFKHAEIAMRTQSQESIDGDT